MFHVTVKGGNTVIVKFALLIMYPIVGYFLYFETQDLPMPVPVSLNINNFDDVV